MKKIKDLYVFAVSAIAFICMLSGCGSQNEEFTFVEEKPLENPFVQEEGLNTITMGGISHGVIWGDNNTYCLAYEGEEMEIPYTMQGSGIGKNCGFLLFLDGIPQPYKVKEQDTNYQYMQLFELEENKEETYTFRFTPVTGKAGERMSICIVSITNPLFMPDMKESVSYGHSHKILEAVYPVLFQADAGDDRALWEAVNAGGRKSLKNFESNETQTDQNFIKALEGETHTGPINWDKDVCTRLYISGESMLLAETADITGKDTVHIKYIILGHPGAEYKTVFYLNHEPLVRENTGETSFLSVLKSGQMTTVEFDLDTAELENTTFYAVSVPCNSTDYPDDVLMMHKSNSVAFYKADSTLAQNIPDQAQGTGNAFTQSAPNQSQGTDNDFTQSAPNQPQREDNAFMQNGLNQFQRLDEIRYAGGDRILLFADKIYLYELTEQKAAAEAEYPDGDGRYGNLKTWITDGGFCMAYEIFSENQGTQTGTSETVVFGGSGGAGGSHIMYAYYDKNLNLQKNIDVTSLGADITFIHQTAPSRDGGRIVVCEQGKGISIYDVDTLEKTEVLQVDGKNTQKAGGMYSVNQVSFAENDSRIVFLGSGIAHEEGYICYGSVKTDGSDLAVHRENVFDVMSVFAEHAIFSEDMPDDRTSGQVCVYYPSKDTSRMIQLSEKKESSYAWASDKGNYCVTAVRDDNVGWTLRLYDVRTAELVSTKVYDADTEDYREPHICYLEDMQTAVLLQRPYGDNTQYRARLVSFQE